MKAWHFTNSCLRNGRSIPPIGKKLVHDGDLSMCQSGLHASKRIIDALAYAPGPICHRVELGNTIIQDCDKMVANERTILWSVECSAIISKFARLCALDVIHLWDAPDVVITFLNTGDENLRTAAMDAAGAAAMDAAMDAAGAAAMDAAWAAAGAAAWAAAGAAGAAARTAARTAAWAAAGAAARAAARAKQNRRLTTLVTRARK